MNAHFSLKACPDCHQSDPSAPSLCVTLTDNGQQYPPNHTLMAHCLQAICENDLGVSANQHTWLCLVQMADRFGSFNTGVPTNWRNQKLDGIDPWKRAIEQEIRELACPAIQPAITDKPSAFGAMISRPSANATWPGRNYLKDTWVEVRQGRITFHSLTEHNLIALMDTCAGYVKHTVDLDPRIIGFVNKDMR